MEPLLALTELTQTQFLLLLAIATLAGIVRGFSGFALSAMVMASAVMFLPPVELIPVCFWLELCASALMARGGWQEADRRVVLGLVIGSAVGVPVGLTLTTNIPVEASKLIVLVLVIVLALTQLAKVRIRLSGDQSRALRGRPSRRDRHRIGLCGRHGRRALCAQPRRPRPQNARGPCAVLICQLATSMIYLLAFGVMTSTAALRAAVFALPCIFGVVIGQRLFTPRLEPYYRPFCLTLLTGLAMAGLIRTSLS